MMIWVREINGKGVQQRRLASAGRLFAVGLWNMQAEIH